MATLYRCDDCKKLVNPKQSGDKVHREIKDAHDLVPRLSKRIPPRGKPGSAINAFRAIWSVRFEREFCYKCFRVYLGRLWTLLAFGKLAGRDIKEGFVLGAMCGKCGYQLGEKDMGVTHDHTLEMICPECGQKDEVFES